MSLLCRVLGHALPRKTPSGQFAGLAPVGCAAYSGNEKDPYIQLSARCRRCGERYIVARLHISKRLYKEVNHAAKLRPSDRD